MSECGALPAKYTSHFGLPYSLARSKEFAWGERRTLPTVRPVTQKQPFLCALPDRTEPGVYILVKGQDGRLTRFAALVTH